MFEWKREYAVGITEIDRQHQELFRMANEIYDMILDTNGESHMQQVLDLLGALKQYADDHFALEESLMVRYEYSEIDAHRLEHQDFRLQLEEMYTSAEDKSEKQMVTDMLKFITQWISRHICTADAAYAPFLRAKLH